MMRMKHEVIGRSRRRPTNVTLSSDLVDRARSVSVNVSQACEAGLAVAVKREEVRRWQDEHRERIDAFSAWLDEHGMPFEELRVF